MALVARIAQPDGKTIQRLSLSPKQAVRAKGVRDAKVEIVDEATNQIVPNVVVRRDGDTIELSVTRNGETQVLILEDGDGAGISVRNEAGEVIDGGAATSSTSGATQSPASASARSQTWPGSFIVGDEAVAGMVPWLWPAALIGGAALLLRKGSTPDTTLPVVSGLDITTATDTGPNDLATRNGTPSLTFSGESGLAIALRGVDGKVLDKSQYTVTYADGKYTVALVDANTGAAGAQAFGSFLNGVPTGNAAAVADGRYTIVATDAANNSADVGSFTVDTTPPVTGPIDITANTDTGNDDTTTRNGLPVLTFTGEEGLTIALKGADGTALNPDQYTVAYVAGTTSGSGTYTVALKDADLTAAGAQAFGSFNGAGAPTGNAPASADGVYTIVATDRASNTADVGTFKIDTTPPVTGPLDITAATDTGADDANTRNGLPIITFTGEPGLNITLKGVTGSLLDPSVRADRVLTTRAD